MWKNDDLCNRFDYAARFCHHLCKVCKFWLFLFFVILFICRFGKIKAKKIRKESLYGNNIIPKDMEMKSVLLILVSAVCCTLTYANCPKRVDVCTYGKENRFPNNYKFGMYYSDAEIGLPGWLGRFNNTLDDCCRLCSRNTGICKVFYFIDHDSQIICFFDKTIQNLTDGTFYGPDANIFGYAGLFAYATFVMV